MNKQVFQGQDALRSYLRPAVENYSPLVELPASLNPFASDGVHIYIKLLSTLPLANVKSIPAWNMLEQAQEQVRGAQIVESSSGNTVFSMGLLAKAFGVAGVKAIASRDVSRGKLDLLRIAGIDVELVKGPLCPRPDDPKSSIAIARQQGDAEGWFNPGQYDNDANPNAHFTYTGPQIYDQLDGDISLFVAGLGTTGTLVGCARYLHSKIPNLKAAGATRVPNNAVPGVRTQNGLDEVAFDWRTVITEDLVQVNEHDSYEKSLALIRHGLLVGPSAGFAYAATLKQLQVMKDSGDLEALKDGNVVFVAPDSMFPYVAEYFEVLGQESFGSITGDLSQLGARQREASNELGHVAELTVDDVYGDYELQPDGMKARHYQIVDVRDTDEYLDHHLPDSINVPYDELDTWLDNTTPDRPIVFVCRRGVMSLQAALLATQKHIEAYSMIGGTAEWSSKEYERVKAPLC